MVRIKSLSIIGFIILLTFVSSCKNTTGYDTYAYTVSFNSMNATIPADPASMEVISPATIVGTLPSPPTKTDYQFGGWSGGGPGGETEFTADTEVMEDITVYAKWMVAVVTTLAGDGTQGSTDANGTAASFDEPYEVAVDDTGNVYVADYSNHLIRKIDTSGNVTTLAGNVGTSGSTDANGTAASFNSPRGVAVDGDGNVYVGDSSNHLIRKIDTLGNVTTLAGTNGVSGSTNGNGTEASFYFPCGIAVDGDGNVYVADRNNRLIRKIDSSENVTTLAGTVGISGSTNGVGTEASFNYPYGVAVDGTGNVFVADYTNHLIRKIDSSGNVTTLAGTDGTSGSTDGNGTNASFDTPNGVAVDGDGNVYVGDTSNYLIRKIDSSGNVTTLAGTVGTPGSANGIGTSTSFGEPHGVTVDGAGNVYVADISNHMIRKIVFIQEP